MLTDFEKFRKLHHADNLFVLPNAGDAKSAMLFAENKYAAIGTSSAAVSAGMGYEDGEAMPFADYLFVIRRILASITVPLTVDMEMGYGSTNEEIFSRFRQLVELGVAGINIEDSGISKTIRSLKDAKEFAQRVEYIRNKLVSENLSLFLNIRCDTYLLNTSDRQKETIKRLSLYEAAGADGIFLPCISNENDIAEAIVHTKLPLNVMCVPGLPDFNNLDKLGVKRVSMGPFLFNKVYKKAGELSKKILTEKDISAIV
jgi:2-methylisocitrate lyase-like PEP mutase family enzyme